jgi:hypothetical protein
MTKPKSITAEETAKILAYCREHFRYDTETGVLYWEKRPGPKANNVTIGKRAGTSDGKGYWQISVYRQLYRSHRLIWLMYYGRWPTDLIDHIDQNKDNNRIENLREVTDGQNKQNKPIQKSNTSGFPGVHWHTQRGKWCAQCKLNGKRTHIGLFTCPIEAFHAHCVFCRTHHTHTPYTVEREAELIAEYQLKNNSDS